MMTLLSTIKKDQLQARKDRDAVASKLLTTLIGEAAIIGKNDGGRETTDKEVVDTVKKFIKNIDETMKVRESAELIRERDILMVYMPTQMSELEIEKAVAKIKAEHNVEGMRGMGVIMGQLKAQYDGKYDGAVASAVVKRILQ